MTKIVYQDLDNISLVLRIMNKFTKEEYNMDLIQQLVKEIILIKTSIFHFMTLIGMI